MPSSDGHDDPSAGLSGCSAPDSVKQGKDGDDVSDFSDATSTLKSSDTSRSESRVGGDYELGGEEGEEVTGSPTDSYPPFEPLLLPDGWQDALDPNNDSESSRLTVQILNAHIDHLRWTYRCLSEHYNNCVESQLLLIAQEKVLARALYDRMAEGESTQA